MSVMGTNGDTKVRWNKRNPDEVSAAKATFTLYKKRGFAAFRMTAKGSKKGSQIDEFDPEAGSLLMVPPLAGG